MGLKKMYQQRLDFIKYEAAKDGGKGSMRKAAGEKSEGRLTRRSFIKLGLSALSALAVLEIGGISLFYLRPRKQKEEYSGVIEAGLVEDFPPGSVTDFQKGNFYLICAKNGGFLAVYRRCTHLGCVPTSRFEVAPVDLGPDWVGGFFCPCHGSKFDLSGRVFAGVPAPTNLVVPPYRYADENTLVIGEDTEVAA